MTRCTLLLFVSAGLIQTSIAAAQKDSTPHPSDADHAPIIKVEKVRKIYRQPAPTITVEREEETFDQKPVVKKHYVPKAPK